MAPTKTTLKNSTPDTIIFRHICKSITVLTITLQPRESHDIGPEVHQTSETFWLLDSAGNSNGESFSTDEVEYFTEVNVTKKLDGSYVLTKVPRPKSGVINTIRKWFRKWWSGNEDGLPTSSESQA